jgi:hypothetical protein
MSGCGPENVYILRVCGHIHNPSRAVCKQYIVNKHHAYYKVSEEGEHVIQEQIVSLINERLEWIAQGLPPNDAEGRARKVYVNF